MPEQKNENQIFNYYNDNNKLGGGETSTTVPTSVVGSSLEEYEVTDSVKSTFSSHEHLSPEQMMLRTVLFEVLGSVRPYYDMDGLYKDVDEGKASWHDDLTRCYEHVMELWPGAVDIYTFDDSRVTPKGWKFSMRLIVCGVGWYRDATRIPLGEGLDMVDRGVYKRPGKRQLMRLPYKAKFDNEPTKDRMARIIQDGDEWRKLTYEEATGLGETYADWIIGNITDEYEIPEVVKEVKELVNQPAPCVAGRSEFADDSQFQLLGMLLQDQEWDWHQWRDIGWALKNISDDNDIDLRDLFHKISSKSDRYDEEATDKIYDVAQPQATHRLGMQTIIGIVRESHSDICGMWQKTNKIEWIQSQWEAERAEWEAIEARDKPYDGIDSNDPYVWYDFDMQWRGQTFKSKTDCFKAVAPDLKRVFAKSLCGTGMNIKKSDCDLNLYDITKASEAFTDIYFNYMKPDGKIGKLTWGGFVQEGAHYLNRFATINFSPGSDDPRLFNLFTGYKATMLPEYDLKIIQPVLDHLKMVICSGDQALYDNIMSWFAHILERPGEKTGAFLFLYSEKHGTGKNSIFKFIADHVIGARLTNEVQGMKPLTGKFNDALMGRKLIVIDETRSEGAMSKTNFDTFKSIVSDPHLWINPKGMKPFQQHNYTECVSSTNHMNGFPVEESDRRGIFVEVSDSRVGDAKYFQRLYSSYSDTAGDHFLTYACQVYGGKPYGKVPHTPLRAKMVYLSKPSVQRFLEEKPWVGMCSGKVTVQEFYNDYTKWCEDGGERANFSKKAFTMYIKDRVEYMRVLINRKVHYDLDLDTDQ